MDTITFILVAFLVILVTCMWIKDHRFKEGFLETSALSLYDRSYTCSPESAGSGSSGGCYLVGRVVQ